MRLIVRERESVSKALSLFKETDALAVDTETTGLYPYHGDTFFSIILSSESESVYFHFNDNEKPCLSTHDLDLFADFFGIRRLWFGHNIKFDMAMLATRGITLAGSIHDTMVCERILSSTLTKGEFSLAHTATRYGLEKLDLVEKYIDLHDLYEDYVDIRSGEATPKPLYSKVPLEIMAEYGFRDAEITRVIGEKQLTRMIEKKLDTLYELETALIPVVYQMETDGVKVDISYAADAFSHEAVILADAKHKFFELTSNQFTDSYTFLSKIFQDKASEFVLGPVTKAGKRNPTFDSSWLEKYPTDQRCQSIVKIRKHKSTCDFYASFQRLVDKDGYIHASFNQHLAQTGRFSASGPNLQNLTRDSKGAKYNVRACIIPSKPGWWLASIDYDQIEYRLAIDYAGCPKLSEKIKNGYDVHQAMADITGIGRTLAKAVNFAMIYGSGDKALSVTIGKTMHEVALLKEKIFTQSPKLKAFLQKVKSVADIRGSITLWTGRVLEYPIRYDKWKMPYRDSYKAANGLCQGGAADIIKKAMVNCKKLLAESGYQTKLIMTVHDELVFSGPPEEEYLIDILVHVMSSVYEHKHVPITASAEISYKNLSAMEKYRGPI